MTEKKQKRRKQSKVNAKITEKRKQ